MWSGRVSGICYINHKSTTFVLILLLNLTAVFLTIGEIQTIRLKTVVKIGASLLDIL